MLTSTASFCYWEFKVPKWLWCVRTLDTYLFCVQLGNSRFIRIRFVTLNVFTGSWNRWKLSYIRRNVHYIFKSFMLFGTLGADYLYHLFMHKVMLLLGIIKDWKSLLPARLTFCLKRGMMFFSLLALLQILLYNIIYFFTVGVHRFERILQYRHILLRCSILSSCNVPRFGARKNMEVP